MSIKLNNEVICFGSTLARPMGMRDQAAIIAQIDPNREVGLAHVIVANSSVPDTLDVHFLADRLTTDQQIAALATALDRLMKMHGKPDKSPLIISQIDGHTIREQAEGLVDFIRSGTMADPHRSIRFDNSREVCIRVLTIAFATVAISPSALANGVNRDMPR
jgi:hypothetical protein